MKKLLILTRLYMFRLAIMVLTICLASTAVLLAYNYFGLGATTLSVISLLTLSYLITYRKKGLGVELAYWGLTYAAVSIGVLGVGLLQSHAGCTFLVGDCYQPTLPSWLWGFKIAGPWFLTGANVIAVLAVARNCRKLFLSTKSDWVP
jgi:hypothetical protein